jgi:CubicO group peptidase (beta-lactamase class C family)
VIRSTLVFAAAVLSTAAQPAPHPEPDAVSGVTDRVFAKWDSTMTPGCALSVLKDGQIV